MSIRLRLLNGFLRTFEKPKLARAKTPDDLRKPFELKARVLFPVPRKTQFSDDVLELDGRAVTVQWAKAENASDHRIILYFHGGGYVFGSPKTHRAMLARLSAMTGLAACLPDYRLAPEHPFPAAIEDAVLAYRALLERGFVSSKIIMGGDSAGGGLVLALLGQIKAQSLPKPAGVFALSPLVDLAFSGPSFSENAQSDVMLPASRAADMAEMYLQGADASDPRASPLRADFTGMPPVFITASDSEILLDDSLRMADHLREQGVEVTEQIVQNHPHVWHIFQRILPEADQGLRAIAAWIKPLLSRSNES